MKSFARVMGLLFGSAGAHTYPKSGQVAPSISASLSDITDCHSSQVYMVVILHVFSSNIWLFTFGNSSFQSLHQGDLEYLNRSKYRSLEVLKRRKRHYHYSHNTEDVPR